MTMYYVVLFAVPVLSTREAAANGTDEDASLMHGADQEASA